MERLEKKKTINIQEMLVYNWNIAGSCLRQLVSLAFVFKDSS